MNKTALQHAHNFLSSWLPYRFGQTTLPGLSVAVAHQGRMVFSAQYGVADTASSTPLTAHNLFGIASLSKMFTAVAVMQLCEQGQLSLDTPVVQHVPWFAGHPHPSAKELTARQLLSHSSGLARDVPDGDFWVLKHAFPDQTALRTALLATPIVIGPNTQLKYSNAGYGLIGQLIEAVSGQSYAEYVTRHIIQPLKLTATFAQYNPALAPRTATGYGVPLAAMRPVFAARPDTQAMAAVAGILSTPEDMCRFMLALRPGSGQLLSDSSKKEMQRSQWTQPDGYDAGLAFGLGHEVIYAGNRRLVGHSGHIAGHLTATFIDPGDGLVVTVMANSKDAPCTLIAYGIFGVLDFFGATATKPAPAARARFNARLLCEIASVEIIATHEAIVALDPDEWQPFAFQERLEIIDDTTLRVVTPGSVFNQHELVTYHFTGTKLASVRYAGGTLLPEAAYHTQLQREVSKTKQRPE